MTQPAEITARAVVLIAVATSFIVFGDTAGKLLTSGGTAPFFVAWSRFALAAAVIVPFCGLTRDEWRRLIDWRIVLRSMLIAGGICSILTALRTEPIANVFGAFFIGPIVSWLLAAAFLGERVSWSRFGLLIVGFIGVLMVVQPGAGAGPGILFGLMAGCFYGCYLAATRWLAGQFRPRFLLASQLLVGTVILAPPGLASLPAAVDLRLTVLVVVSALASAIGNYLLVLVNRTTPASVVAPLIYVQLIAAVFMGIVVFGDFPDLLALAGLATILASGLGGLLLARTAPGIGPVAKSRATK